MSDESVRRQVRDFLTSTFFVATAAELTDQASLLEAGIVDSTGVLEVIGFLENAFGFHVQDEEIVPENLDTVEHIVAYVLRRTTACTNGPSSSAHARALDPFKVSVVVTCYNYGRFLANAVESALNQTYRNLEIVVVDDGSTDDTPAVMEQYGSNARVRYIRHENRGQAAAKNEGIRESHGQLVAFLDADDEWEREKLTRQVPLFGRPEVGVVYSGVLMVDEDGRQLPFEGFTGFLRPRSGRITEHLAFDNVVPFSSSVVRRAALERAGFFDESLRMGIDWDLWLRISLDYEFQVVDEPLIRYRVGHPEQMSRRTEERFASADRILARFIENHPRAVAPPVLRRAKAYGCVVRAIHSRGYDWSGSTRQLLAALKSDWTFGPAYLALATNVLAAVPRWRKTRGSGR